MLVSLAILAAILLILAQMTSALRTAMVQTTSAVQEFEAAQTAFETMTRRISQATLNSYNDTPPSAQYPSLTGYTRASELRFISGPSSIAQTALNSVSGPLFATTSPYHPTHGIFFQAPLGIVSSGNTTTYGNLVELLNTCGYYIEWNSDVKLGIPPTFIPAATYVARWRFRLMELIEPSDSLTIFKYTSGANASGNASLSWTYTQKDWFQSAYSSGDARPIADNVILLAFLPMVAPQNATTPSGGSADGTSLDLMNGSNYIYDSAPIASGTPPVSQNQLPPMVYVLMIAVDESSFYRYQMARANSSTCPSDLGVDNPGGNPGFLTNATYTSRQADIQAVESDLAAKHIKYRVFSSIVVLSSH
jgi:uncharacterized protein (TIGR02599 family)